MVVNVRLFAVLRERAGSAEVQIELPEGARVADALERLRDIAGGVPVVMAINRTYATEDAQLAEGDELALIPPVSGGCGGAAPHVAVRAEALSLDALAARVRDPRAGAVVTFAGVTRTVEALDYEAYAEMATEEMARIVAAAIERHGLCAAAAEHRVGRVLLGEASVIVAASAPHRGEAFAGARAIIDEIKARAPIWKREEGDWVSGTTPSASPPTPATTGPSTIDIALKDTRLEHGSHVILRHATCETRARVGWLGGRFHQLRCEAHVEALLGDPVDLLDADSQQPLGSGVVLDPNARMHGPTNDTLVRLTELLRGAAAGG
jgi:molybdopterin synthase catalytic subunit